MNLDLGKSILKVFDATLQSENGRISCLIFLAGLSMTGHKTNLKVQLTSSDNDVLAALLQKCFDTRVSLIEQLESSHQFGHFS